MPVKFEKWTFVTVPNIKHLKWMDSLWQILYLWINHHTNQYWNCFPSITLLSKESWMSKTSVRKYLKVLEDGWFITIKPRYKNNVQISNLYQVMIIESDPSPDDVPPTADDVPPPRQAMTELNPIELNPITKLNNIHHSLSDEVIRLKNYHLSLEQIEQWFEQKKTISRILFICSEICEFCDGANLIPTFTKDTINGTDMMMKRYDDWMEKLEEYWEEHSWYQAETYWEFIRLQWYAPFEITED